MNMLKAAFIGVVLTATSVSITVETLREMDFANKQLKPDAPKVGGDNIICVSYFGFPEKMDQQAPEALDRIKHELLYRILSEYTEGLEFSLKSFFHTITKRHFSRQAEWNARCRAN